MITTSSQASSRLRAVRFGAFGLGIALLTLDGLAVLGHSVNVLHWDDWAALDPGGLGTNLDLGWIFSFHNVHRTVWTNLSIWLLYRICAWNINVHIALNFILFVFALLCLIRWLEGVFRIGLSYLIPAFATAIPAEVHLHASNGQWTFAILFSVLALVFEQRADLARHLGPFFAVAAAYAMGTGLVLSLSYPMTVVFVAVRRPEDRKILAAHVAVYALGIALWFLGYPGQREAMTPLTSPLFWGHFGSLVAGGLGIGASTARPTVGWAVLALLLVVGVLETRRLKTESGPESFNSLALLSWTCCLLLALASISHARAWAGVGGALSGRYLYAATFLILPLCVLIRRNLLSRLPRRLSRALVVALYFVIVGPFLVHYDYDTAYGAEERQRAIGLRCLQNGALSGRSEFCPSIEYDASMAALHQRRAIALRLSYVRQFLFF